MEWALEQLGAIGYISTNPEDRGSFCLTDRGIAAAQELLERHTVCDKIILTLLLAEIVKGD